MLAGGASAASAGSAARLMWSAAEQFQRLYYGQRLTGDLYAELTSIAGGKHFVSEAHRNGSRGDL